MGSTTEHRPPKAAKPADSRSLLSTAKSKLGTTIQSVGNAISKGGATAAEIAYNDALKSMYSSKAEGLKTLAHKSIETIAAAAGNKALADKKHKDAAYSRAIGTAYDVRATVGTVANRVGKSIDVLGQSIAAKGVGMQSKPKQPNTTGVKVVDDLARAARALSAGAAVMNVGDRVAKASADHGMNKPHPNPSASTPGANRAGSNNSVPASGRSRGFQNPKNQAAAQRAKGNKYDGPTE